MTDTDKKKIIDSRVEVVEKFFQQKYEQAFIIREKKCFKVNDSEYFLVSGLKWANAIVLEHAFSENEARKGMFDDGDLFYMEDYGSAEKMIQDMIREIEE